MRFFGAELTEVENIRRLNAWLLALALLMLFGAATAALMLASRARESGEAVAQTIEVRSDFQSVLSLLQDTETGQRGYLLTRDPQYLEPYNEARFQVSQKLETLERSFAGDPLQEERIKALRDTAMKRIAILDGTITLARQGNFEAAIGIVGNDRGKALMDESRTIVDRALEHERLILAEREERAVSTHTWLSASLVGAIGAALVLAVLSIQLTRRQFASMQQRRDQLARLNEELESRVAERTRELELARELAEAEAGRAEYERGRVELLLRDVTHRVGNNLAMVSSLLRMQQAKLGSTEARAALETARGRIQTISTAQRRLRLGDDLQSTRADDLLEAVISDLADASLENGTLTITGNFEPLVVASRDATTLAVVLGELVSNAIKHAFRGRSDGTITASFTLRPDGVPVLAVIDDGVGFDAAGQTPTEGGLGSMIIENLSRQYGGEILKQKTEAGGTSILIALPKLEIRDTEKLTDDQRL
ncbi:MAG: CHASE3 domain-containing protein [Parvibaculum sp.]